MEETYKFLFLYLLLVGVECSDVTKLIFGPKTNGLPAAFGDFNSDELTDVFILQDNETSVEILLAHEEEPLLRSASPKPLRCDFKNSRITSVVPGDFDGDAFMDVLVTALSRHGHKNITNVHILWGGADHLNCSDEDKPILKMIGQPLAIDYNQDMILDLFGVNLTHRRIFWVFSGDRSKPREVPMEDNVNRPQLKKPHSHAFLDLNHDYTADLFITTKNDFEIWLASEYEQKFIFNKTIPLPSNASYVGQASFTDVELRQQMDLIVPVCMDPECKNSQLMMYTGNKWHNLQVNFKDDNNNVWRFARIDGSKYTNVITLYHGDFNMDGYPDILTTLSPTDSDHPQSFLLLNVPCQKACGGHKRSYDIKWNALNPFKNGTVLATFFDFYQDGILDVILVTFDGKEYKTAAFKNSLDYDANFIKVMVLTGLTNTSNPMIMGRVGKKRRTYGTNLPGPKISYSTVTQNGNLRQAAAAQLPQSAHFSLNLPYTIFGLGRTPNFVDSLVVGLSNHTKEWPQIIPNSQMVVIPWPSNQPNKWRAQLFVTPSKLILMSVAALTGVCGLITLLIGVLYWKERQEDKKERLSESHRFHFDAM
ncbi:hypothetical protein WA026_021374 [Henosepilachna vigintioctopunctata]|uniref:T-cell immunomodulatory protein TIP C2 domain-containing protein n=1 Tax=Henosepilachna vigintioctopunctata TaxID=420089 RepID=A0AAW1TQP2_9CUCU